MTARSIVLCTGGNSGIGYETVKALLQSSKPYHILLGSRSLDKAEKAIDSIKSECASTNNTVEALQVDLTSDASIENAFDQVESKHGRVDALVNNAGASFDLDYLAGKMTDRERFTKAYDVNVAGTHVMSSTFMPLLLKSKDPRLLLVSGLSNITGAAEKYAPAPEVSAGWPKRVDFEVIGYRCSKVALNMLMLDYNYKLEKDGVKVWGVLPGFLATNLGGRPDLAKSMNAGHPSAGGEMIRRVVEGDFDAHTGKLVAKDGVRDW